MKIDIKSSDRITICGLPRTGKTTFARYLASLADPHLMLFDPLDQFGEFDDKLRYVPRQETPAELEIVCKQLWSQSNKLLLIEECEQFMPQGKVLPPYTSGLIRMGRNWGIGVCGVTRRIQDLSKRFFDLCQHVFFFRCGFKSREYIANLIGNEYVWPAPNPRLNKTGYTITTLPPFHALHFNLETEQASIIHLNLSAVKKLELGVDKKLASSAEVLDEEPPEESEGKNGGRKQPNG